MAAKNNPVIDDDNVVQVDHFRVLSDDGEGNRSLVLYLVGDTLPSSRVDLPAVAADPVDGRYVPGDEL